MAKECFFVLIPSLQAAFKVEITLPPQNATRQGRIKTTRGAGAPIPTNRHPPRGPSHPPSGSHGPVRPYDQMSWRYRFSLVHSTTVASASAGPSPPCAPTSSTTCGQRRARRRRHQRIPPPLPRSCRFPTSVAVRQCLRVCSMGRTTHRSAQSPLRSPYPILLIP